MDSRFRTFLGQLKRELYYRIDFRNNTVCRKFSLKNALPFPYKRIYHYHIRKTGGTSLNSIFLSMDGLDPKKEYRRISNHFHQRIINNNRTFVGWNPKLLNEGNYYYGFSHIPMHKLRIPKDTFKITCLRDPINRLLSHYTMLLKLNHERRKHPCLKTERNYIGSSFLDFIERIPKKELLQQIYMFSEEFDQDEAFERIVSLGCFMVTENFDVGIDKINQKLNLSLKPIHVRVGKKLVVLSEKERQHLQVLLRPEYTLLNRLSTYNKLRKCTN